MQKAGRTPFFSSPLMVPTPPLPIIPLLPTPQTTLSYQATGVRSHQGTASPVSKQAIRCSLLKKYFRASPSVKMVLDPGFPTSVADSRKILRSISITVSPPTCRLSLAVMGISVGTMRSDASGDSLRRKSCSSI